MYTRYEPEGMSLSGIPKLDGVVPASAYQLVRGSGIEAGAEDLGFVTIHYNRRGTVLENYGYFIESQFLLRQRIFCPEKLA